MWRVFYLSSILVWNFELVSDFDYQKRNRVKKETNIVWKCQIFFFFQINSNQQQRFFFYLDEANKPKNEANEKNAWETAFSIYRLFLSLSFSVCVFVLFCFSLQKKMWAMA